jgi:hypothetical protein
VRLIPEGQRAARVAATKPDKEDCVMIQRFAIFRGGVARGSLLVAVALLALLGLGCDDTPTSPSERAIVTFGVADEQFRVELVGSAQIEAARAAQSGGPARIPNGRIVTGTGVNTGWSWHLEDVAFAESTIELCDGRPSDVQRQGVQFGGGRFCPWNARVLAISTN